MTRRITYAEAFAEGLDQAMAEDERVVVFGRDLVPHGVAGAERFDELYARFASRFISPPISELGLCGLGAGAAMTGLRPFINIGTGSFLLQGFAAVANEAAVSHYMSNGRTRAPALYHIFSGIRGAGGVQHSHAPHALFLQTPGIQIVMPSCPHDVKGLLRYSLLRSQNPTLFVNHQRLLSSEGEVPEEPFDVPFGQACVRREGRDLTVAACGIMVPRAIEAAGLLEREGVSIEVLDVRTLVPFDLEAVVRSVRRTGRLVAADESQCSGGAAAEIVAKVTEAAWADLKARPRRVAIPDVPIPFSEPLEVAITPSVDEVVSAVRQTLAA